MTVLIPEGSLIVSCQARDDSPLHGPRFMAAMALAARGGGAAAIRANGADDVRAVKAAGLPVIGINKVFSDRYPVYITPDFAAAAALAEAGADLIALDCTPRPRAGGPVAATIRRIIEELKLPVFADVSILEEGLAAEQMGSSFVSTTLSGYTAYTEPKPALPDLELVAALARRLSVPVIAEGRFNTPELARAAIDAGAHAVVVGTMITDPREITRAFASKVLGRFMTAFLGIDVGGTASRWAAIGEDGALLARGAAQGATGHLFAEAERTRFAAVVAGIAAEFPTRPVGAVHAGITGLGSRAHAEARAIIGAAFGCDRVGLDDDMGLAFHAVFAPGAGHLVSAGTGSIGLHVRADGETVRIGGRGILVDDAGSGSWIALSAIDRLYRLIDETGSAVGAEKLASALYAAMGGSTWDDVRSFVYGSDRGGIGMLARAVAGAAAAGDPLARRVMADAATELARLGTALIGRAGNLPVAFIGGVLELDPGLKPALAAAFPGINVSFPNPDAALRAAQLARDYSSRASSSTSGRSFS